MGGTPAPETETTAPADPAGQARGDAPNGGVPSDSTPTGKRSRASSPAPTTKRSSRSASKKKGGRADGAAPDGYVGRSQYKRKGRGLVSKVAVHLSPEVATALRRAGAVGDKNGANMSEIVETLLVRAGYTEGP